MFITRFALPVFLLFNCLMVITCTPADQEDNTESEEPTADQHETEDTLPEEEEQSSNKQIQSYIGTIHPPIPEGIENRGGALAQEAGEAAANTQYSFQDVFLKNKRMLWLSKIERRDTSGKAYWRVIDVVELPEVASQEEFLITGCTRANGDQVAAIAQRDTTKILEDIEIAWAADREQRKLVEITPDEVECINEGLRAP